MNRKFQRSAVAVVFLAIAASTAWWAFATSEGEGAKLSAEKIAASSGISTDPGET